MTGQGPTAKCLIFLGVSGLFLLAGLAPSSTARAGVGTDIAAAGCGAVTDSFLSTEVAVDPHHLSFAALQDGDPPPSQDFAVECTDYDSYGGDCGGSVSVNQSWLKTDRDSFFGVDRVEVWVDPAGLEPGTYTGKVHVKYDFIAIDDTEDVNVELEVEPGEDSPETLPETSPTDSPSDASPDPSEGF